MTIRTLRRVAPAALFAAISLSSALLLAMPAAAQYVGPHGVAPTTVADVLKDGKDDQQVVLRGRLTKKVGSDKYEFTDSTETIRVEIDAKRFPAEPIDDKVLVEIHGEIEKDFMASPEVDVDVLRRVSGS